MSAERIRYEKTVRAPLSVGRMAVCYAGMLGIVESYEIRPGHVLYKGTNVVTGKPWQSSKPKFLNEAAQAKVERWMEQEGTKEGENTVYGAMRDRMTQVPSAPDLRGSDSAGEAGRTEGSSNTGSQGPEYPDGPWADGWEERTGSPTGRIDVDGPNLQNIRPTPPPPNKDPKLQYGSIKRSWRNTNKRGR